MTFQKSTKTILFASLIAAMILPFSMMDYAEAEKATSADTIKADAQKIAKKYLKIQDKIENVKENIEKSTDREQKAKLETKLEKLNTKLDKLEKQLDEKVIELSYHTSNSVSKDSSPSAQFAARDYTSSNCNGLINENNDCTSTMTVHGDSVTLIQPIDDYTTGTCPSGSPTTICADFTYAAYDIPGWYQKGNDFYFYSSGYTNTCPQSGGSCSTWAVVVRLPNGDSADISMTDAPTGIPLKTTWYMTYSGLLWNQLDYNRHVQQLNDGYDPYP